MAVEVLITLFAAVVGLTLSTGTDFNPNEESDSSLGELILQDLGHTFATAVVTPSIVYWHNSELRKYAWEFYGIRF